MPLRLELRNSKMAVWLPYILLIIFFGVCFLVFQKDFEKVDFSRVPSLPGVYLLAVGMSLTSYVIRAVRWRIYLRGLGYVMPLGFSIVTYLAGFAYTLAPGKVGELLKFQYYRPLGITFPPVAAAFFVERMTDLAVFVCLALFFWGMTTDGYGLVVWVSGVFVPIAFLAIGLLDAAHIGHFCSFIPGRFIAVNRLLARLLDALQSVKGLLTLPRLAQGFALGACGWLCEAATLYALSYMFPEIGLTFSGAIGIYAVAIVIGAVTFLPGGLGGTEAAMMALLLNQGYSFEQSAMLTGVCRLLTLWVAVASGWVAVIILKYKKM